MMFLCDDTKLENYISRLAMGSPLNTNERSVLGALPSTASKRGAGSCIVNKGEDIDGAYVVVDGPGQQLQRQFGRFSSDHGAAHPW